VSLWLVVLLGGDGISGSYSVIVTVTGRKVFQVWVSTGILNRELF
jgi:hypothetical protein